eukprot:TRINITY_DN8233_c0_g1_i2.p1 TRINITY_DN8233_c0_g1~~TRINITY_DN8233_c0_g1_i2.p1  ORF type:complete len:1046 (-),score=338.04 TRINITY_DN8233_c0_g1_i2:40-3177(-)
MCIRDRSTQSTGDLRATMDPFADDESAFAVFSGATPPSTAGQKRPREGGEGGLTDGLLELGGAKKEKLADELEEIEARDQDARAKRLEADEDLVQFGHVKATRLNTSTGQTGHSCTHDIAYPEGYDLERPDPPPCKPAREYPFSLDPFQRESIKCIEKQESVLVSAHTSAGKTVVAEYAIATCLANKQRVVYTSPIKALSNQKFREFQEEFQDVGLMTGDVTINPDATCLVMTTEILRSMLYKGSEVMREIKWVVFDEIHYMRDKERGVVWEETLILLPDEVRFVFLSATIPNAVEFAQWVATLHDQPCHVVYTEYRPTPLQHFVYPAGGQGIHLVVDERGVFREDNFQRALAHLQPTEGKGGKGGKGKGKGKGGGTGGASSIAKIVKMIVERNYEPVIIFAFSKKDCEALAQQMSKMDLNTEEEKDMTETIYQNAIDGLSEDDKRLPQVEHMLPILKRGIGIHHSGLLPILKEVIEILFQEGYVKALFATETFSMGLNMPAKTVVFTSVRKFDGEAFRWISGGEYIQMSGRAGRRGLDDRGIVVLMVDEKLEPDVARGMLMGQTDPLNSSFHIGYNMLLNLLRVEEADPEYMIKRSFHQFQSTKALPTLQAEQEAITKQIRSIAIVDEDTIAAYAGIESSIGALKEQMRAVINNPKHAVPFLQPGRVVHIKDSTGHDGWAAILNFKKVAAEIKPEADLSHKQYVLDVLVNSLGGVACLPGAPGGEMSVLSVPITSLDGISQVRIYVPKDLRSKDSLKGVGKSIREVMKQFKESPPLLDPIENMEIKQEGFDQLVRRIAKLEGKLVKNKLFGKPELADLYAQYNNKCKLVIKEEELGKKMRQCRTMIMKDELKGMRRVLRRLGHTDQEDVIQTKGRVACELNAGDELLATELIFAGVFNDVEPEQVVALMSCLVYNDKIKDDKPPKLAPDLEGSFRQLEESARKIARVAQEAKLTLDTEEYVTKFNPGMMDLVFQWCKGAKFAEVMKLTDQYEGSIIRVMKRLDELLRQMAMAFKAIGNLELEEKFNKGAQMLKRDIVFAASLYL